MKRSKVLFSMLVIPLGRWTQVTSTPDGMTGNGAADYPKCMSRNGLLPIRRSASELFRSRLFFSVLFITCSACQPGVSEDEYLRWVTDYDNSLHVRQTVLGLVFDIQYQPDDFMRIRRSRAASGARATEQFQYYVLKIGTETGTDLVRYNASDRVQKQEREYYLSYRFQNDITLEENGSVLPCLLYHSEGATSRDGARTFVLGFEKLSKPASTARMVIRSDLFGSLPIKIKVAKAGTPILQL